MAEERDVGSNGIVNIKSTYNNTVISIADAQGNVLSWASGGTMGFKGTRKGTPYAAQMAAEECGNVAKEYGIENVVVRVKGPGSGREAAIRSLESLGFNVRNIEDVTPTPHNGCKLPKRRRI